VREEAEKVAKGLEEGLWSGTGRRTKSVEAQREDWCLCCEE
jgi:hypothetical protein